MRSRSVLFVLFLAVVFVRPILADSDSKHDGNEFLEKCGPVVKQVSEIVVPGGKNPTFDQMFNIGFCLGFMRGIIGSNGIYESLNKTSLFCFPESGIEARQALRIIVKYLEDHPQDLHYSESTLAILALQDAFPCKKTP